MAADFPCTIETNLKSRQLDLNKDISSSNDDCDGSGKDAQSRNIYGTKETKSSSGRESLRFRKSRYFLRNSISSESSGNSILKSKQSSNL